MTKQSSLRVDYNLMAEETAVFLGFGRDSGNWGSVSATHTIGTDDTNTNVRKGVTYDTATGLTTIKSQAGGTNPTGTASFDTTDSPGRWLQILGGSKYLINTCTSTTVITVHGDATQDFDNIADTTDVTAYELDITAKMNLLDELANNAYRKVLSAHDWHFLKPTQAFVLWADVAVAAGTTITGAEIGPAADDFMEVTASAASFHETMEGKSLVSTGDGTFTIAKYISTTVVHILNTASTAISSSTFSIASDGNYLLPRSVGQLYGDLTFASDEAYFTLPVSAETEVLRARMNDVGTTTPRLAAIRHVDPTNNPIGKAEPQRLELMVWPEPETTYNVSARIMLEPDRLDDTINRFPLGPVWMGALYLQACRATAEQETLKEAGEQTALFERMLPQFVARDSKNYAEFLGYNQNDDSGRLSPGPYGYRSNISSSYV